MPKWEGRDGVGIIGSFNIKWWQKDLLYILKKIQLISFGYVLDTFLHIYRHLKVFTATQKWKMTQNWLLKCAPRFFIGSQVRHLLAVFASGRFKLGSWSQRKEFLLQNYGQWTCNFWPNFFLVWFKKNLFTQYTIFKQLKQPFPIRKTFWQV